MSAWDMAGAIVWTVTAALCWMVMATSDPPAKNEKSVLVPVTLLSTFAAIFCIARLCGAHA